jgi:hypothetical protein
MKILKKIFTFIFNLITIVIVTIGMGYFPAFVYHKLANLLIK